MKRYLVARGIALFIILIAIISVPAAASSAVIYGSTSGFLPERHTGEITVVYTLPGFSGGLFNQDVDYFTDPLTDVIFIGNDDEFSSQTADAIEQAVWDGKVLVIGYPATNKFGDSLPVTSGNTITGSNSLVVTSLNSGIAKDVFSDLNKTYTVAEPVAERLTGTLKPGSISLLKFNTGEPALVYRAYGSGFVVEWMLSTPDTYLGVNDADTINFRVIKILLATVKGSSTPVTTAVTTTISTTVPTTAVPTPVTTPTSSTGNAMIQSNPLGANVFFDGVYKGTTPIELEELQTGYHSVRMTMDGYYDFDGSAYIVEGETITVFGSLPEKDISPTASVTPTLTTQAPTPTTAVPTSTATQTTTSDALANPTVIAAGIGIITAGIGAYATIYSHKSKDEKGKKE